MPSRAMNRSSRLAALVVAAFVFFVHPSAAANTGAPAARKILFLGNSITLHAPKPDIGWTGNWGMAASEEGKDYVHLLTAEMERATGAAQVTMVRNIAAFEREYATFDVAEGLKEAVGFRADIVIVAIGENVPGPADAGQEAEFAAAFGRMLAALKDDGGPAIFVRGSFWPHAVKDGIMRQAAADAGAVWVDISALGADRANAARSEREFQHEGVAGHPGDKGMRAIADALFSAVSAAGKASPGVTRHVSPRGDDSASGSEGAPWRTIQRAVSDWQPGDTVLVASGVYRERVELKRGGRENAPVTLAAAPGAEVVVTGADVLDGGWSMVAGAEGVFSRDWVHRFPIGGPNELTHPGDEGHALIGRAEQVIAGGRMLRQVLRREQLEADTFFVDLDAKKLLVRLRDGDPARVEMEAGVRTQWLAGENKVGFVCVRGMTFRHAANHAQRGAFILGHESARWLVENCTFERANGPGATFTGAGHVVRRCTFQDNGQLGFGAWACHDTRLEECVIARNNTKGYSTAWEAGGCKITMSRGFAIHRSRAEGNHGPGIWYDIGNEQAEVAHCRIADNDEAGIFYEISYGLHAHDNLVVNNANQVPRPPGAWGFGGITLSSSEDCVVENNTLTGNRDGITFREQNRTTPRIAGGEVRVLNRNHTLRRNVLAGSREFGIGFWMDTTFFGPHPKGHDKDDPLFEDPGTLNFRFEDNVFAPLPGTANFLYGCKWRTKSRTANTPAEFTALSGIADTSVVATHETRDASAAKLSAGVRDLGKVPGP